MQSPTHWARLNNDFTGEAEKGRLVRSAADLCVSMPPPEQLVHVVANAIANAPNLSAYAWPVKDRVWALLQTGFDHAAYGTDTAAQNIALKVHLAQYWPLQNYDERLRLAWWIVRDWGGIRRNKPQRVADYVEKADAKRPTTPFEGVASYSKILAMKHPDRYAIYDARVAAAIMALQVLNLGSLDEDSRHLYPIPQGRNVTIAGNDAEDGFVEIFTRDVFVQLGFSAIAKDAAYSAYLELLGAIAIASGRTLLQAEMFLFSSGPDLCRLAMSTRM